MLKKREREKKKPGHIGRNKKKEQRKQQQQTHEKDVFSEKLDASGRKCDENGKTIINGK